LQDRKDRTVWARLRRHVFLKNERTLHPQDEGICRRVDLYLGEDYRLWGNARLEIEETSPGGIEILMFVELGIFDFV